MADPLSLAALDEIPYLDFPELKFSDKESTQMPFRYVKDKEDNPIMPEVSLMVLLWMD